MFLSIFDEVDDEIKAERVTSREVKLNEFGDRVGKTEICQGILLLAAIGSLFACASIRGCQEVKKHYTKENVQNVVNIKALEKSL